MVGYIIIGLLLWGGLGYVFFHFRYHDTGQIDDLRSRYKTTHDGYEAVQHEVAELNAQNTILKQKTAALMQQNEDYSKLISELSRYYFHIKQATGKVEELGKLLRVFDTWLDQKLTKVGVDMMGNASLDTNKVSSIKDIPVTKAGSVSSIPTSTPSPKFF